MHLLNVKPWRVGHIYLFTYCVFSSCLEITIFQTVPEGIICHGLNFSKVTVYSAQVELNQALAKISPVYADFADEQIINYELNLSLSSMYLSYRNITAHGQAVNTLQCTCICFCLELFNLHIIFYMWCMLITHTQFMNGPHIVFLTLSSWFIIDLLVPQWYTGNRKTLQYVTQPVFCSSAYIIVKWVVVEI